MPARPRHDAGAVSAPNEAQHQPLNPTRPREFEEPAESLGLVQPHVDNHNICWGSRREEPHSLGVEPQVIPTIDGLFHDSGLNIWLALQVLGLSHQRRPA